MKKSISNGFIATLSLINTSVLLVVLLSTSGINALSWFNTEKNTKSKGVELIQDVIEGGKVITSYSAPKECEVITIVEIESAMSQVGEITTVTYDYSGLAYETDCNRLFKWEIGFTRNRIEVDYEGTIRAGYVIEDIIFSVDNKRGIIMVTLPEVQVFSNEITDEDIDWEDNFTNRIDPDVATDLLDEAKEDELEEAIRNGLYVEAKNNAHEIITSVLSEICDYEIVFTSSSNSAN